MQLQNKCQERKEEKIFVAQANAKVTFPTIRAQLFEGRLVLNLGLNLTRVSLSCVQKHFLGQFSLLFLELPIIKL